MSSDIAQAIANSLDPDDPELEEKAGKMAEILLGLQEKQKEKNLRRRLQKETDNRRRREY